MKTRTLWLWLSVWWLVDDGTVNSSSSISICDLGPCTCTRGKLVCDCSTSVVQNITLTNEQLDIYSFSSISVTNCSHVHVASRAFSSLPALQQISVAHTGRLTMEERAFDWTTDSSSHNGLLVNVTDCVIAEIPSHCFRGFLRDILMSSVNITNVRAFAFTSIAHAEKIEFNKVKFINMETQSFKRFGVDFLTFRDTYVNLLPERTLMDVEVYQEVRFDCVYILRVETNAVKINEPRNFKIVQSTIGHVESRAFHVHTKGDVSIHDNRFNNVEENAFLGFTVDNKYNKEAGKQDLVFENNTIVNFEMGSLTFNTSGFNARLDWLIINQKCSCDSIELWETQLVFFSPESKSKTPASQLSDVIYCLNPKPTTLKEYSIFKCNIIKSSLFMKVAIGVGVMLVLLAISATIYFAVRKKAKRYINVPMSLSALKPADSHKAHMLVVPDGKTYRETELHVIVEHAEPIIPTEYVKDRPDVNDNQ